MTDMTHDTEHVARDLYAAVNDHDLDRVVACMADDFRDHERTIPDAPPGREGARQAFEAFLTAFPDLRMDVEDIICEGDRCACRIHMHGTHEGELMGIPASRKPVDVETFDILRIRDGHIVEHWGLTDDMLMMQQMGVAPATPTG